MISDAESSIANLKEDLESKSRDVDVIRECLVELRAQVNMYRLCQLQIL